MQVMIDLWKNGKVIEENLTIPYGSRPQKPSNRFLKDALVALKDYQLEESLNHLAKALELEPDNPEIYFHMACAHSVLEQAVAGYDCIKEAVENNFQDLEMILNHDMLAFLRIQDAFEDFVNSNFSKYDASLLAKK